MKPRKWIIAVCLLVLVLASGLYFAKRSLERNRNLEQLLIQHISPVVGGTFDVEKVRIGFFSVDLTGVKIIIPLQSFALNVQDIKIGFSFFRLIASRGDFSKSINKIIFVDPVIDVSFPKKDSSAHKLPSKSRSFSISAFPVKHLLVNNCTIRLIDRKGEKVTIGEQLTGRIWGEGSELNFELKGKCAAKRRNLFLSGVWAREKGQQHVSMRLDRARIKKPIRWQNCAVVSGMLDGVCEFSFSDTVFPYNIDAHGLITIKNGVAKIDGVDKNIEDAHLKLKLSGNRIIVDTLTAQWNGMAAYGRSVTGFSPRQESRFFLRLDNIKPRLFTELPALVRNNVSGDGWVEIEAIKMEDKEKFIADLSAGGFTIGEQPIIRIAGKCSFTDETATADTIYVEYPGISLGLSGLINFTKSPLAYSFSVGLSGNAQTFMSDLTGKVTMTGDVHGLGGDPRIELQVMGKKIVYNNVALGNPWISVINRKNMVVISSKPKRDDVITLDGTLDSIHLKHPSIHLTAHIHENGIRDLIKGLPEEYTRKLKSASFAATVSGKLPNPEINGRLQCKGKKLSGACNVNLSRNDNYKPYRWQVYGDTVYLSNRLFPLSASGTLVKDTIHIDTFAVLEGVTGSGLVKTGVDGQIDLTILSRNVSLAKLNAWFLGENKVVKKGFLNGNIRVFGSLSNPRTRMKLNLQKCNLAGISSLETDAIVTSTGKKFTVLPFVVRKNKKVILAVDTVSNTEHISFSGTFTKIDIGHILGTVIPENYSLEGYVSGRFSTSESGLPVNVDMRARRIKLNTWKLDSVKAHVSMSQKGIDIEELSVADSSRSHIDAHGTIPWPFLSNTEDETDTMHAFLKVNGDLISSLEHNVESPIGGKGPGEILIDFSVTSEGWHFHKAQALIPKGVLKIKPSVPDKVKNVTLEMHLDNQQRLHVSLKGKIDKRPVSITSSHVIPEGYEPLMFGPVNCGVLQMRTPKKGINVFVLGFMEREKGNYADIEFAPRKPFDAFTISGPSDKPKITGTWILRNTEFTYPLIEDAPFPEQVVWNMDIRPGNRKVIYFYNVGGKRRRLMRFTEGYLDPSSTLVKVRGSFRDGSFKVLGKIRSYRGDVFYGRNFDRNYRVELDFAPRKTEDGREYDNMPIICGSAEAFSDTSRFDRIKLTLLVRDKKTGALQEKGRFNDITFRVSSDFEEIPGEAEMEFYREAGLNFVTFERAGKKAGEMVSSFGDQYINRYFLQRIERRLAKRLGLDVISFETSIASNYFTYFYNHQNRLGDLAHQWDYLAFANVGVTLGRYFMRDKIFLKWRTELIPKDFLLTPEHNIGLEYQPMEYFWVDINYGFFRNEEDMVVYNPKLRMQLRLPIGKFRSFFDF